MCTVIKSKGHIYSQQNVFCYSIMLYSLIKWTLFTSKNFPFLLPYKVIHVILLEIRAWELKHLIFPWMSTIVLLSIFLHRTKVSYFAQPGWSLLTCSITYSVIRFANQDPSPTYPALCPLSYINGWWRLIFKCLRISTT